jgi:hypothetical protein
MRVTEKDSTGQVNIPYRFVTMSVSSYHNNIEYYALS